MGHIGNVGLGTQIKNDTMIASSDTKLFDITT